MSETILLSIGNIEIHVEAQTRYTGTVTTGGANTETYRVTINGVELEQDGLWPNDARVPTKAHATLEEGIAIFSVSRPRLTKRLRREKARRETVTTSTDLGVRSDN